MLLCFIFCKFLFRNIFWSFFGFFNVLLMRNDDDVEVIFVEGMSFCGDADFF